MKTNFRNHLAYTWWIYCLIPVAVIVIWVSVFQMVLKPKPYETINISFVGEGLDCQDLQVEIESRAKNHRQDIQEINVESVTTENSYVLNNLLMARSIGDTDFVIVTESNMLSNIGSAYFVEFDDKLKEAFTGANFYSEEDMVYGIRLDESETFKKYYHGEEKCYLFITAVSENFAALNGKGETENDFALMIAKYLMGVDK